MGSSKWSCGCNMHKICKLLLIVGGLNWGLVGIGMLMSSDLNWNVVNMILGSMPILEAIVYILVGIAAVMKIVGCRCKDCKNCTNGTCDHGNMDKQM